MYINNNSKNNIQTIENALTEKYVPNIRKNEDTITLPREKTPLLLV